MLAALLGPLVASPVAGEEGCAIALLTPGILATEIGNRKLGTREAGGAPATAEITATGPGFRASIAAPEGFLLSPAGAPASFLFEADFSGTGASVFTAMPPSLEVPVEAGTTLVRIDLEASPDSGVLAAGQYGAAIVLRCE